MKEVVREEWSTACDGDEIDMANWAIKWGNPLMDVLARGVLNDELKKENNKLRKAIQKALNDEESGDGWGPDNTVCGYLREALDG